MIKCNNNLFDIKFAEDKTFTLDSTDNLPFDKLLNPSSYKKNDRYTAWKFLVKDLCGVAKTLILIAPYYTYGSVLLENDTIIFLFNTSILTINLNDLDIEVNKPFSDFGIFFSIHTFDDGYIIYGELEIIKLTKLFAVEWSYPARDIFVTNDGRAPFTITGDKIYLNCWDGFSVTLDKSGKEV